MRIILLIIAVTTTLYIQAQNPPTSTRIADTTFKHNDSLIDYYSWLENINNPKISSLIAKENKYFKNYIKSLNAKPNKTTQ